jgi:hypothetical protein
MKPPTAALLKRCSSPTGMGFAFSRLVLLDDRASYLFEKGDFVQSAHFNSLALSLSLSAKMPWTLVRGHIREAKSFIRMNLPIQALNYLGAAEDQLKPFPNAELSAEVVRWTAEAKRIPGRPEEDPNHLRRRR